METNATQHFLVQQRDENRNKLYPATLASAVIVGTNDTLERVLTETELRLVDIEDRLTKVEGGDVSTVLTKLETLESDLGHLKESIETLNADASTEGSVDNKIAHALGWETVTE